MPSPQYTAAWVIENQSGIDGLRVHGRLSLPPVKDDEILVKLHAASLNYRELAIATVSEECSVPCPVPPSHLPVTSQSLIQGYLRVATAWSWAKRI